MGFLEYMRDVDPETDIEASTGCRVNEWPTCWLRSASSRILSTYLAYYDLVDRDLERSMPWAENEVVALCRI